MRTVSLFVLLVVLAPAPGGDPPARLPAETRLLLRYDHTAVAKLDWLKKEKELFKPVASVLAEPLTALAVDVAKVEHVWLALSSSYPTRSLLIVRGGVEPAKIVERLQAYVRDRKYAAKALRDGDLRYFSIEIPVAANPIPGFPGLVFVGIDPESRLLLSLDAPTLQAAVTKKTALAWPEVVEPYQEQLQRPLSFVLVPPVSLTETGALLAGVNSVTGQVSADTGVTLRLTISTTGGEQLVERLSGGLEQAKQLFPPLAQQQGVHPKLARLISELLTGARLEPSEGSIAVTTELPAKRLVELLR